MQGRGAPTAKQHALRQRHRDERRIYARDAVAVSTDNPSAHRQRKVVSLSGSTNETAEHRTYDLVLGDRTVQHVYASLLL